MKKISRLTRIAMLTGLSLSLFLLEGLIPLPFLAPGAKLGLANILTALAFFLLPTAADVLVMLLLRTLLASFFGGGPTIFLYSVSGALLSFLSMNLLLESKKFSLLGVSVAGGFMHNLGQLMVAVCVMESPGLWRYLGILGPCGIVTGGLIGLASTKILEKLPHSIKHSVAKGNM